MGLKELAGALLGEGVMEMVLEMVLAGADTTEGWWGWVLEG